MKLTLYFLNALLIVFLTTAVKAQDLPKDTAQEQSSGNLKAGLAGQHRQLEKQMAGFKKDSAEAREEEKQLRARIHEALQSGDHETAVKLKEQLMAAHQQNKEEMHSALEDLKQQREEFRNQRQEVFQEHKEQWQEHRQELKDRREDFKDKREEFLERKDDFKGRREDFRDRREDFRDKREDIRDRREDARDKREDVRDARHNPPPGTPAYRKDKLEDIRDHREDRRDKREDIGDRREDFRDRRHDGGIKDRVEDRFDRRENRSDKKENLHDKRNHPDNRNLGRPAAGHHPNAALHNKPNRPEHSHSQGSSPKGRGAAPRRK